MATVTREQTGGEAHKLQVSPPHPLVLGLLGVGNSWILYPKKAAELRKAEKMNKTLATEEQKNCLGMWEQDPSRSL